MLLYFKNGNERWCLHIPTYNYVCIIVFFVYDAWLLLLLHNFEMEKVGWLRRVSCRWGLGRCNRRQPQRELSRAKPAGGHLSLQRGSRNHDRCTSWGYPVGHDPGHWQPPPSGQIWLKVAPSWLNSEQHPVIRRFVNKLFKFKNYWQLPSASDSWMTVEHFVGLSSRPQCSSPWNRKLVS